MKHISVLAIAVFLLTLTACGSHATIEPDLDQTVPVDTQRQTLAQQFLSNTSTEALQEIVYKTHYLLIRAIPEFTDPAQLPMRNILNLYLADPANAFIENEQGYAVSVQDLEQFTEKYFGTGIFDLSALQETLAAEGITAVIENDRMQLPHIGLPQAYANSEVQIVETKAQGDQLLLTCSVILPDNDGQDIAQEYLTLQITPEAYRYVACQFTARPFAFGDIVVPLMTRLPLEQIDACYGQVVDTAVFEWAGEHYGQNRTYADGTELLLYLGDADSDAANIYGIVSPNPQVSIIAGVRVGDSWESVVEQFMHSDYPREPTDSPGITCQKLYGTIIYMASFGYVLYEQDEVSEIYYAFEGAGIRLYIDNGRVAKISIRM